MQLTLKQYIYMYIYVCIYFSNGHGIEHRLCLVSSGILLCNSCQVLEGSEILLCNSCQVLKGGYS